MNKNNSIENDIIQSLSQPILLCEKDNKIVLANYAAEIFFGASTQTLKRFKLDEFFSFDSPILSLVSGVLKRKAPMSEYKMKIKPQKNGDEQIVDIFATFLNNKNEQVALLFQERTIAEKLDRQLVSRSSVRSVIGLAAMLSHEIKNPLSGIRGAAQLLEKSVQKDDVPLARLIRDETDRIVNLLDKVDVFGDERPLEGEPLNIHIVLDRVKLLAKSGVAKNIEFIEQYDPSLPPVFGNFDHLIQVFFNLVKNASNALQNTKNPKISLSTSYKPGMRMNIAGAKGLVSLPYEIIIQDNGAGVPAHILPNMFDPFVTTKTNGSGLGLAMVAKIISDHGGVIDVSSQPGKTRFKILLPIVNNISKPNKVEKPDEK